MTTPPKTVAFLGASNGVGHFTLKHALAAGYQCIALCRTPATLTDALPLAAHPNLRVIKGNAHDITAVSELIRKPDGDRSFVDTIVTTIGGKPSLSPHIMAEAAEVCQKGMATLLAAIAQLREAGAGGRPHVITCGTTGVSRYCTLRAIGCGQ